MSRLYVNLGCLGSFVTLKGTFLGIRVVYPPLTYASRVQSESQDLRTPSVVVPPRVVVVSDWRFDSTGE